MERHRRSDAPRSAPHPAVESGQAGSADEKLVVRHEPSPVTEGETVWCVDLPA